MKTKIELDLANDSNEGALGNAKGERAKTGSSLVPGKGRVLQLNGRARVGGTLNGRGI